MTDLSIIMPCYNRAYDLHRILLAYDQQAGREPFELIAVDDASTDETYAVLTGFRPRNFSYKTIRQETNRGPAAARNLGIRQARGAVILFVGDDILPDRDLVKGHLAAHRKYPSAETAILGQVMWGEDLPVNTLMAHIDGIGAQQFSYYYLKNEQPYDFRHFYTANISLKRELLFRADKWFDEDFAYAAFEDVELSFRLSRASMQIIYCAPLVGYHYHYHTIWSFSIRQYRAGLMSCVIVEKHPAVARLAWGPNWKKKISIWKMLLKLGYKPSLDVDWLESQALQLGGFYEWQPHPLLDHFYLQILTYYYYKGILEGSFGETANGKKLGQVYASQTLAPLLAWFIRQSLDMQQPLPQGVGEQMIEKITRGGNWASNQFIRLQTSRMLAARTQRKR